MKTVKKERFFGGSTKADSLKKYQLNSTIGELQ